MNITLTLTKEEVDAVVAVLGDLPTKTGAFPLVVKIAQQLKDQEPKKEEDNANA